MGNKKSLTYQELIKGFEEKACELESYGGVKETVNGERKHYRLYKIVVNPQHKKTLLITSGFHGEEFNGPISLLNIFDEISAYAKKMRVRLIIYPCINPSGFDLHKRYNASDEEQNNDFMRYELGNGKLVGMLKPGEKFKRFKSVLSPAKEVRYLQHDLENSNLTTTEIPDAVLDIHQQKGNLDNGDFYAYNYDNRAACLRIMKKIGKIAKVARRGSAWNFNDDGRLIHCQIDDDGLVLLYDGSITDFFHRSGSEYAVCAETNADLALEKVCAVNMIWVKELIKLIAKE